MRYMGGGRGHYYDDDDDDNDDDDDHHHHYYYKQGVFKRLTIKINGKRRRFDRTSIVSE